MQVWMWLCPWVRVDGGRDGQRDGQTDGWLGRWVDGWMDGTGHAVGWRMSKEARQSSPARCPSTLLPSPHSSTPQRTARPAACSCPHPESHCRLTSTSHCPSSAAQTAAPTSSVIPCQSQKPPHAHNHHGDEFGSAQAHTSRGCGSFPSHSQSCPYSCHGQGSGGGLSPASPPGSSWPPSYLSMGMRWDGACVPVWGLGQ